MKKNLKYVAIAFVIFYVLSSPTKAAHTVNRIFDLLGQWGEALATFVGALG